MPSPDGRYLLYGVARDGWPALEALDLATGVRFLFRSHACAAAWGPGDEIAYVHYLSFHSDSGEYSGRIMVQRGLLGVPQAWSGSSAWGNLIWAGSHLLANTAVLPQSPGPLEILYGPGQERSVDGHPSESGPVSIVVALNPQGTEALLDTQRGGSSSAPSYEDLATLLRIDDDSVLSTAVMSRHGQGAVEALAPDGYWQGGHVITSNGYFDGGYSYPSATLITLTVSNNQVRLGSARAILQHGDLPLGQDQAQTGPPRPLDPSGRQIAVWYFAIGQTEYLTCDTLTGRCANSRNYGDAISATFITNPSRPL